MFLKWFWVVMLWVGNDVGEEWLQEVEGAGEKILDNSGILVVNCVHKVEIILFLCILGSNNIKLFSKP